LDRLGRAGQTDALRSVSCVENRLPPRAGLEIPAHRLGKPGLEALYGAPAELALDLRGIDRVAAIMTRPVGDEGNQLLPGALARRRIVVEQPAYLAHDIDIPALLAAADIVSLAGDTSLDDQGQRASVILDIEPIAHILAIAVDWQRLSGETPDDHVRDELLGEVIGPVIVRAIGEQRRQPVSLAPGAHQMIRRRLRGCVRRVRRVWRGLGEQALRTERAIALVGRDVVKAEASLRRGIEAAPMTQRFLEQGECSGDI